MSKDKILKDFNERFYFDGDFICVRGKDIYPKDVNVQAKLKDLKSFLSKSLDTYKDEVLDRAIAIFEKLPDDEPMTKNPVILELKALKSKHEKEE